MPIPLRSLRYRRCPQCQLVRPALGVSPRPGRPVRRARRVVAAILPSVRLRQAPVGLPDRRAADRPGGWELMPIRYRRCPGCQVVRPASEFRRATGPAATPTFASREAQRRRCLKCDHVAPLMSFLVVMSFGDGE